MEELEPRLERAAGALEREGHERHLDHDEMLIDASPVVVCVGDGLSPEDADLARRLASHLGGAFGATSRAVAAGVAPPQLEVGVLKRSIAPLLLLALGVGAADELDAVRGARTIITVDADPDASAHGRADLAVVAEPADLARAVLEEEEEQR